MLWTSPPDGKEWFFALLLVVAPILSLIALFTAKESKSWLALFLKRKTLEEQKKIDELNKPNNKAKGND
jgi:hypothetical protein